MGRRVEGGGEEEKEGSKYSFIISASTHPYQFSSTSLLPSFLSLFFIFSSSIGGGVCERRRREGSVVVGMSD